MTPRDRLARRLCGIFNSHYETPPDPPSDDEWWSVTHSGAQKRWLILADEVLKALELPETKNTIKIDWQEGGVVIRHADWLAHKAAVERLLGKD
jgi:hypothetical protein